VIDFEKAKAFFRQADPVLFAYSKKVPTLAIPRKATPSSYAFHLYSSIISQQISVKAADAILQRFLSLVGDPHDPACVLAHDIEDFRTIGLSRQKASYIRSIAELTQNGTVRIDHLDDLSDKEVVAELVKIKGVGQWTAEMFLMFTLARPDVFSVGDLGLLNAAKRFYNTPNMTKEELLRRSETWSPHRTIAALLLWHSLDNKPALQS
jgi:DNA-3-methyladenine glycosylase II